MSDCTKYIELISSMVDGELSAEQELELRTHIEHCDECRKVYEAFMGISDALSEDLVEPPEMLTKGIMFKINMQKKGKNRFAIGRFTAIAACLALILFGASHFGILNINSNQDVSLDAPKAVDDESTMYAAVAPETEAATEKSFGAMQDSPELSSNQMLTAGEGVNLDQSDGTVFQMGFPMQNYAVANGAKLEDIEKEPVYLIETTELSVYDGKYYMDEDDKDKNKLLFTVTDKDELKDFTDLLTSAPENADEYEAENKDFLNSDPMYTIFIPADKNKDDKADDRIICIWVENEKIWCVTENVGQIGEENDNARIVNKILYRAVGVSDELEDLLNTLKDKKHIT